MSAPHSATLDIAPPGKPAKPRRRRLRWTNVSPGPTSSLRNRYWEALDGPQLRYYATFVGINERGIIEWELNQWRHGTRAVYGPFGTLSKCKHVAEWIRHEANVPKTSGDDMENP